MTAGARWTDRIHKPVDDPQQRKASQDPNYGAGPPEELSHLWEDPKESDAHQHSAAERNHTAG
jgi:hypothetical protein